MFPTYALFPHRDNYDPGCTTGWFSPAAVTLHSLLTSRTLLYHVYLQRIVIAFTHDASAMLTESDIAITRVAVILNTLDD
jgi:hypothetical protein